MINTQNQIVLPQAMRMLLLEVVNPSTLLRRGGLPPSPSDLMIASIARTVSEAP